MEKNFRKKQRNCKNNNFKSDNGITLVALIVTIIVLLILAAVSLSAVFSQEGIFSRAEQATGKYGQAKARETLELAFGNLQAEKYEARLTATALDTRITEEIGKIRGEEIGDDKREVIVDGYRFTVDRTVPKIIEELGPADGVIISASIRQNDDLSNPKATVTGIIKTYSGGTITSSTAEVIKGNADVSSFPTTGGSFTIADIAEDTDITITATDSNKKTNTRTIHVVLVRDDTPPVISNATAILSAKTEIINGMKIQISANATDPESGITSFTYKVEGPGTVTPETGKTFTSGVPLELTTNTPGDYTVTFTATNGAGNTVTTEGITVTTSDAISIADLKRILKEDPSKYPDYLGTKVNYKPDDTKAWRLFYYDANNDFKDGAGTIYLKREYDKNLVMTLSTSDPSDAAKTRFEQLNREWVEGAGNKGTEAGYNHISEIAAANLCDGTNPKWEGLKTADAKWIIGGAPIEMWCKAQNAYKNKYDTSASTISCGILDEQGYGFGINGGDLVTMKTTAVVNMSIPQSQVIAGGVYEWSCSPASGDFDTAICQVGAGGVGWMDYNFDRPTCPVVCLINE